MDSVERAWITDQARKQTLEDVAAAFETRKPREAMRCLEVAKYCREQAALIPARTLDRTTA